jgi:sugar O-acyltransferase (sialic acid O-acetyltransferase NeuD family)
MRPAAPLVIVGAGRHGRELESYLRDQGGSAPELLGFIDEHRAAGAFGTSSVLGNFEVAASLLRKHGQLYFITAAGDNRTRQRLAALATAAGLTPWTLQHPAAVIGLECDIGAGTCIAPGTVLTRAIQLGRHCIVNVGVTVSHDCSIGDFTNLNPGVTVCGDVRIDQGCYIGAGATVIDKVSIGAWTVVGAGAVVVAALPPGVLALGVPARVVRHFEVQPNLV